ncbi:MAG TPA: hypothetical protein VNO30_47695 [Kofleriaceae bacterium]|nr:hypothetical protein [Kofleriaceae bacterium]
MSGVGAVAAALAVRLAVRLAVGLAWAAGSVGSAGCSGGGERVAECDALLATLEKARACGRLEPSQRSQVGHTVRSIKEALDRLEEVSPNRAPATVLEEARRTCARQDAEIRRLYEKDAPECLQ